MDRALKTSVFIVGGGPIGLAMALLLSRYSIDCVIVERNPSTTDHPKSRGCWARTMELFRQCGIEKAVRARGLPDRSDVFEILESIAGHKYGRTRPEPNLDQTPSWRSMVAQDAVEEEICNALSGSKTVRLHFSTEFLSFDEVGDQIRVLTRDTNTGLEQEWSTQYLVAADGAGSRTRGKAEIEMIGPSRMAIWSNDYWRGDLSRFPSTANTASFIVIPEDPTEGLTTLLNTNGKDRWLTTRMIGVEHDERPQPWTKADAVAMIRRQIGDPEQQVEIISQSVWHFSSQVAEIFSKDRVFLIGDAAHRLPPTGGFGLNTGMQDVQNLAWKIAFVLRGWASEQLLDSYGVERRPVAVSNANVSLQNSYRFPKIEQAMRSRNDDRMSFVLNDFDNHLNSVGQVLGHTYEQGAVIPDGTAPPPFNYRYYTPSDRPGSRFPHVWTDHLRQHSTLDWFDDEFVVVAGPAGSEWLDAGKSVSKKLGVPLGLRTLPSITSNSGIQLGIRGAALVRPDGHVAWRMAWLPSDPEKELADALMTLLHG